MKVEKINITKEIMDIPDNMLFIKIAKQKSFVAIMKENSDIPNITQTIEEENWMVQRVKDMYGQNKKYLVKTDDKELFTELLKITDSVLNKKIKNGIDNFKKYDLPLLFKEENERIKKLPFWKRLLKQF